MKEVKKTPAKKAVAPKAPAAKKVVEKAPEVVKAAPKAVAEKAPEAVKAISAGTAFKATAAQFPRDQMRIGLAIALAKYMGAHVPSVIPIDVELVDKSNAETFAW